MSWEKVKLSNICEINNGFAFKSVHYSNDGARVIRITNVQKGKIVDNDPKFYPFDLLQNLDRYEILEDDIMMSLTGNVGRVGKFPKEMLPAYINQRICRIKPISDKIDSNYLFQFLNSDLFEKEAIYASAGAAQLNLSTNWVANYQIPLPPLPIQKAIAEKLDKADALRKKDKELLKYYDELAQSVFIDMFGDPVRNEKGWETEHLEFFAKKEKNAIVDGPFGASVKQSDYLEEGIPMIRISNIKDDGYYDNDYKYISENKYNELIRSKVQSGDILLARVGHTIGKSCIFDKNFTALLSTTGVCKITVDQLRFDLHFIHKQMSFSTYKKYIRTMVQGAGQPYLNLTMIKSFKLISPPLNLQNQFGKIIQNIEQQKQKVRQQAEESENLFQALLQQSFS